MHRAVLGTVVICVIVSVGTVTVPVLSAEPEIVELYPNPAAPDDDGEFVTLEVPPGTNLSAYQLADRHTRVQLPSVPESVRSEGTTITFSTDPNRTASLTNRTVKQLPGHLQLANGGDNLRLLRNGTVIQEVEYERAPETELYEVKSDTWRPLGATDWPVVTQHGGTIEAFVLPDTPDRAVEFLESATDRILLTAYTLTSEAVVDALRAAHERGVTVEVLVDGNPVGGIESTEAAALDTLARAGIPVQVIGGDHARYRHQHAKYAVVDDRALVTTENWTPSGTGGKSSRGWAVVTSQETIVDGLVETFYADTGWVDTADWEEYDDMTLTEDEGTDGTYPTNFEPTSLPVDRTRLVVAPDNVEKTVLETIDGAEESIDIKQVQIGGETFPFLQAVLDAADRGVTVRVLLSGAWYAEQENEQLKRWLEEQADAENLPLSVRIAEPDGTFEKIHAKGLIVDGETTFVGSVNWNNNSVRNNREVGLLLDSEPVAEYFGSVFEHDWNRGDSWQLPVGYLLACLLAAILAILAGWRLEFET